MNGATADPCVKRTRPPKTSRNRTIGTSQYFLRARRNAQNSARNDMAATLVGTLVQNWFFIVSDAGGDSSRVIQ
jgi:hypothetical protein